ncbi:hypothetical protein HFO56_39400 [Rhizobium laguerreae]|uniref:hypothetical protein n=1 Tax=Rhizobium laguerreae TaxID=1076926 RepID=UPI001C8FE5D2|nr:hypothetical protein [Rhizobium laguerreae]MBY3158368.1 hypothetical protein [Rhizobium laguerreae]
MTLLATEGEAFMIHIGEGDDALVYGPFVARVSIQLDTAMESYAEWFQENGGDDGAEKLLHDTLCSPGMEKYNLRTAAFAAWLVHVGGVDVKPAAQKIGIDIRETSPGVIRSSVTIGQEVFEDVVGAGQAATPAPRFK